MSTEERLQIRNDFNPITMIPETIDEAFMLVMAFNGKRLPGGHPLDFQNFDIKPGLVILSAENLETFPDRQNLWQFMKRISVPAIPLIIGGGNILDATDATTRQNWREAAKDPGGIISVAKLDEPGVPDFKANPVTLLFKSLSGKWLKGYILLEDCLKDSEKLLLEISSLDKPQASKAQRLRFKLKEVLYYLITGKIPTYK